MRTGSYTFRFRTGKIIIDHTKCAKCETYACVKADSLFGTNVLRLQNHRPILATSRDDATRRCNECLACEIYCQSYGKKALAIRLDTLAS